MLHNVSKSHKISRGATTTAGAAGTSAITGATLDMAGFDSVLALIPAGAVVVTGTAVIKWQGGELADNSDMADLEGTGISIADTDDDTLYFSELTPRPEHRYVRIVITRATANSTFGGIAYIQRGAHKVPVTHGSGVSGELHVDPAEGTA